MLSHVIADVPAASSEERVLLSDVLEASGEDASAQAIASGVLDERNLPPEIEVRALVVLGRLAHKAGRLDECEHYLSRGIRLAARSDDDESSCEVELAALGTIADTWAKNNLAAFISSLRRRIWKTGDRFLIARLHEYAARFEVIHGNVVAAESHLRAGRSLFEPSEHVSLAGKFAAAEAGVCSLSSQHRRGLVAARRALRCFTEAGQRWNAAVARATESWLALLLGLFGDAEDTARQLVGTDEPIALRMTALDTLAQIYLATDRVARAEREVAGMESLMGTTQGKYPTFYELHLQESPIRLALALGQWSTAENLAGKAVSLAMRRHETPACVRFTLFKAEAQLQQGRLDEASKEIEAVAKLRSTLTADHRAHLARVEGLADATRGQSRRAIRNFQRAAVINVSTGNRRANLDTARTLDLLTKGPLCSSLGTGLGRWWDMPSDEATQHFPMIDTLPHSTTGASELLDSVALLLEEGSREHVRAFEAFLMFRDAGCAEGLALESTSEPGTNPQMLASSGWSQGAGGASTDGADDATVVHLGNHEDRRLRLLIRQKPDPESRATVIHIQQIVEAALALEAYRRDEQQRASLWPVEDDPPPDDEVYHSHDMRQTLTVARRIAPTALPVLITGETGTGKEVLARTIHRASPNASKPFLAFNCSAVPRDMIESQLFGYRRGAFTGASESFPGVIRAAAGGTLFLDEIGDLGLDIQPKLLRFLDTKEIHPLGQPQPITVDVRVIAATNADLDQLVSEGRFREDLFYRLQGGLIFKLPPLRRRREEIPALVQQFVRRSADELSKGRPRVSEEALEYLLLYRWPGNVRQLANEIRRVVALVEPDAIITPDHLSPDIRASRRTIPADQPARDGEMTVQTDGPLAAAIEAVERRMVARALERNQGRLEAAARDLGISRKGLFLKRRRLGLDPSSPSR